MSYQTPCGQAIALSGESCANGNLCGGCEEILRLRKLLKRLEWAGEISWYPAETFHVCPYCEAIKPSCRKAYTTDGLIDTYTPWETVGGPDHVPECKLKEAIDQ